MNIYPKWTLLYQYVNTNNSRWVSKGIEFFDDKEKAETRHRYLREHQKYSCTLRPYHHTDFGGMNPSDQNFIRMLEKSQAVSKSIDVSGA